MNLELPLSPAIWAARPVGAILAAGINFLGDSDGDDDPTPESRAARNADIGLAPVAGPTW
jgi:hypothetical protein